MAAFHQDGRVGGRVAVIGRPEDQREVAERDAVRTGLNEHERHFAGQAGGSADVGLPRLHADDGDVVLGGINIQRLGVIARTDGHRVAGARVQDGVLDGRGRRFGGIAVARAGVAVVVDHQRTRRRGGSWDGRDADHQQRSERHRAEQAYVSCSHCSLPVSGGRATARVIRRSRADRRERRRCPPRCWPCQRSPCQSSRPRTPCPRCPAPCCGAAGCRHFPIARRFHTR